MVMEVRMGYEGLRDSDLSVLKARIESELRGLLLIRITCPARHRLPNSPLPIDNRLSGTIEEDSDAGILSVAEARRF
jgi:hypothetical protein